MVLEFWAAMLVESVQVTHREGTGTLRTDILTAGRHRLKRCDL